MLRQRTRTSWQREINQAYYARSEKTNTDITGLLRSLLLLLVLVLSINFLLPVYASLGEPGKVYLRLMEPLLPGLHLHAGRVSSQGLTDRGISLPGFYNMILGGELAGFSGTGGTTTPEDIQQAVPLDEPAKPEHLVAAKPSLKEDPSADSALPLPEEEPVSFLTAPTEMNSEEITPPPEKKPKILIYHTHTTESFIPVSGQPFTSDLEQTVVFLGELLTQILEEEYGIPVLHNREIFDIPRSEAYNQARPVIAAILEENPQLEVVVDLHRDGISREITTFSLNEKETARILFVVGTRHGEWNSNYRFALFLQNKLDQKYPGLCRGTRRQTVTYNQHLHPRSVLVEIGSHENTRDEVLRTVPYLAEALAAAFD